MASCTYCNAPATTEDHIPPRGLYARPLPASMLKVPACGACNGGYSLDDEYFRAMLSLSEQRGEHPDATAAAEAFIRSLLKPKKIKFRRRFFKTTGRIPVRTPDGLALPPKPGYAVDFARLERVVSRIVRALYLVEVRERLPLEVTVRAFAAETLAEIDLATMAELRQDILEPLLRQPVIDSGRGVLTYRWAADPVHATSTAWELVFYHSIVFLGLTLPPGDA